MTPTAHTASTNAAGSTVMTSKTGRNTSMPVTRAAGHVATAILLFAFGFHAYPPSARSPSARRLAGSVSLAA